MEILTLLTNIFINVYPYQSERYIGSFITSLFLQCIVNEGLHIRIINKYNLNENDWNISESLVIWHTDDIKCFWVMSFTLILQNHPIKSLNLLDSVLTDTFQVYVQSLLTCEIFWLQKYIEVQSLCAVLKCFCCFLEIILSRRQFCHSISDLFPSFIKWFQETI